MKTETQDLGADEVHLTALESVLVVGTIGSLLLATWEVGHLMADDWFAAWVRQNPFVRRRVILYGVAFAASISSTSVASRFAFELGRFGRTVSRAFLWYGTLLLLSTIAIFVLDCLPEVVAGFIGAAVFIAAIYLVQSRYFTADRLLRTRLRKGACFACGEPLPDAAVFCPTCHASVGKRCSSCEAIMKAFFRYCPQCGNAA